MDRKLFNDSVVELPDQPGVTPMGFKVNAKLADQSDEKITLSFSLSPPADAESRLENLIAKGETVSPQELGASFGVPASTVDPLVAWLKGEGFAIDSVSSDGTNVFATGTVTQIEKSLAVDMVRVTKGGITYTSARNAPSLPKGISASVHAIGGLQPFLHAQKQFRFVSASNRRAPVAAMVAAAQPALAEPVLPQPNIANAPPYLVSEVLSAYDANGLGLTGKGQVIAILIDTAPDPADLQAFWQRNSLPVNPARVTVINVKGGQLPKMEGEETLDAQWSSGIASGADIRIYASGSLQFTDLDQTLDRIISDLPAFPTMRQLSISLGLGESFMQKAEMRAQHARYLRLAAAGVNVFVSSGDAGSNPDATGHGSTGPLQAEYASSDSAVIGVGGTTLKLGVGGNVSDESGWPDGGGGRSTFFTRPAWQKGKGVQTGNTRLVPDVSLAADPGTGALIIFNGKVEQIGGTSWSAPVWAGFCALINEARANAGKSPLPFLPPLIYPLIGTAAFRDVISGSNGAYHAAPGYDMVTGMGVPNMKELVKALTA